MARYTLASCRLCRREGTKLYLKGARCYGHKCAFVKRPQAPGQHGQARVKLSDYGIQLREKQKLKRAYGVLEGQFRGYFHKATRVEGITGESLLQFLERRLDNVVYRTGLAGSRKQARQMVFHGHVLINGSKVDIPSYIVKPNEVIKLRGSKIFLENATETSEKLTEAVVPGWLSVDVEKFQATMTRLPVRKDVTFAVREQFIVELYSK